MDARMLQYMRQVANHHPYFALAHALVAKGTYMLGEADANKQIGKASLYVADRGQLKRLILDSPSPSRVKKDSVHPSSSTSARQAVGLPAPPTSPTSPSTPSPADDTHDVVNNLLNRERLISEVYQSLETLKKSKESYLAREDALYSQEMQDAIQRVKASLREKSVPKNAEDSEYFSRRRVDDVETASAEERESIVAALARVGSRSKAARLLGMSDRLLAKKMKAYDIPTLRKGGAKPVQEGASIHGEEDLAASSQRLNETIPSEPLADLYIKQGKIQKAIEVYEKMAYLYRERREDMEDKIRRLREQDDG